MRQRSREGPEKRKPHIATDNASPSSRHSGSDNRAWRGRPGVTCQARETRSWTRPPMARPSESMPAHGRAGQGRVASLGQPASVPAFLPSLGGNSMGVLSPPPSSFSTFMTVSVFPPFRVSPLTSRPERTPSGPAAQPSPLMSRRQSRGPFLLGASGL